MIDEITLDYSIYERNDLYTDNALGYVAAERLLEKNYYTEDDTDAYLEGFLNEEFGHIGVAGLDQRNALADLAQEKNIDRVLIPSTFYHFIPLNRADPNNPQPAVDENGNRIDQGLHPLFGDKLTRQAIARAYDVDSAVEEIFEGLGVRQTSYVVPSAWSYNYDLPPIPYDPELALEMLAKSGWVPENSDQPASADNRLVCQDCLYAREVDPDFNGSYFEFDILWNEPNDLRRRLALTVQEDLNAIGITANLVQLTFNDYLEAILGQTFDAAIVGLQNGIPYTPDTTDIFGAESDQPGRGLNFTSFYDEGYYALEQTALTVAGCGLTERTLIYRRMQEIIQDDVPAIYIGNAQREYAHHEWLVGVEPYPNSFAWNIDTWRVVHDE